MIDTVFLNGTVGAGKTTVALALSALEGDVGRSHAVIDLDQIRLLFPAPTGDPFQHEVELQNLTDLARNYRRAGAEHLILAGVVEHPDEIPRYRAALDTDGLLVCRLTADEETIRTRLAARHVGDPEGLRWHLNRTVELAAALDAARLDDVEIDTTGQTPRSVAHLVQATAGWGRGVGSEPLRRRG